MTRKNQAPLLLSMPAAAMSSLAILLVSAVYGIWLGPLPVGHFWWDWLSLIGAAMANQQGLEPFVDYWTTFLLPIALTDWAIRIGGLARAFMVLHALQLAAGLAAWTVIATGRLSRGSYVLGLLFIWVACFVPVNYAHTGTNLVPGIPAYFATLNFNTFYNRFGVVLLFILFILSFEPKRASSPVAEGIIAGLVLLALFFSKFSMFYIGLYCLGMAMLIRWPDRGVRRTVAWALVTFLVGTAAIEFESGSVSRYLEIIGELSRFKAGTFMKELEDFRLEAMGRMHGYELILLALATMVLLLAALSLLGVLWRHRWAMLHHPLWRGAWMGVHVIGFSLAILLNTLTSYGDQGLLPIYVALVLAVPVILGTLDLAATEPDRRALSRKAERLAQRLLPPVRIGALAVSIGFFGYFAVMLASIGWLKAEGNLVGLESGNAVLDRSFTVERKVAQRASAIEPADRVNLWNGIFLEPEDFVFQARQYGELGKLLGRITGESRQRILALTLPAFLPAILTDAEIPRGGYSWLHVGHEFSAENPPPLARMLAGTDLLVRDLCEANEKNRRYLFEVFEKEIRQSMRLAASSTCWEIYERTH